MTTRRSFRAFVFWLHTWFGLNISIYLGILFLSGTLLALAPEIEAVFDQSRRADNSRGPLPVGAIFDNIHSKWPDARIERIERGRSGFVADHATLVTQWGERALVWTDPQTGEISGLTGKLGFKDVLRAFHDSLLTQHRVGNILVTISGPVMMVLIVTGLISYRRFWRGFFRLPARGVTSRAYWGGLHRITALWSLPFLLLTAVTGFYFFLGALGATAYSYPKPSDPAVRSQPLPAGFNGVALQRALAVAEDEIPGLVPEVVVLPIFPGQSLIVQGQADAWFVRARANTVTLDPSNLAVVGAYRAEDLNGLTRIREASDSLHFGQWGGTLTRILWFVFGSMLTSLCFFGAMVYARRMTRMIGETRPMALRVIWHGMFPLKWLLPLGLVLGLGAGSYLYVSKSDRWIRVSSYQTTMQADGKIQLAARGKLREGKLLPLRLRLDLPDSQEVSATFAGQDQVVLKLTTAGNWQEAFFDLKVGEGDNSVTITLPDGTDMTWHLGRPVF